ncbi:hypothetical protein [Candidatus Cardinium hertigii]|jgi:hypothetical protein|uniref:DUF3300 domain-containing protein n=1 Tax=Candidatus Cardinium hertigii TaxID=247481 RepID=A0A3N2QCS3_9BACT|nr:hypothetical protein [Candidatus Cardinium hertigii]ROT47243.1 hypothetical protein EDM02_03780 [Candidatus Cardinium hertigii]ROT47584.1 hypothetical protein EDM02_01580 [Candidatus Cardinium hertigii]ROT47594.1 hypothetical protein EDM02_01650 [Candidatus Cardinium hertigii]
MKYHIQNKLIIPCLYLSTLTLAGCNNVKLNMNSGTPIVNTLSNSATVVQVPSRETVTSDMMDNITTTLASIHTLKEQWKVEQNKHLQLTNTLKIDPKSNQCISRFAAELELIDKIVLLQKGLYQIISKKCSLSKEQLALLEKQQEEVHYLVKLQSDRMRKRKSEQSNKKEKNKYNKLYTDFQPFVNQLSVIISTQLRPLLRAMNKALSQQPVLNLNDQLAQQQEAYAVLKQLAQQVAKGSQYHNKKSSAQTLPTVSLPSTSSCPVVDSISIPLSSALPVDRATNSSLTPDSAQVELVSIQSAMDATTALPSVSYSNSNTFQGSQDLFPILMEMRPEKRDEVTLIAQAAWYHKAMYHHDMDRALYYRATTNIQQNISTPIIQEIDEEMDNEHNQDRNI